MKTCTKCHEPKVPADFYRNGRGYLLAECKVCTRNRTATRYRGPKHESIKEKDRTAARQKSSRIKDATFAAYGGYVCACCGEREKKFLSLDHIENDGASFRRKIAGGKRHAAGSWTYRWLARNGFPSGYQVLCMNCNFGKRMNKGVCPHVSRCNDHSQEVGASAPKRSAPVLTLIKGTG